MRGKLEQGRRLAKAGPGSRFDNNSTRVTDGQTELPLRIRSMAYMLSRAKMFHEAKCQVENYTRVCDKLDCYARHQTRFIVSYYELYERVQNTAS